MWGLERGYCMMIGGEPAGRRAARSDLARRLPRAWATSSATPGRERLGGTAEQGYLHCGPNGAGHFVKMVHNGIEYGIMAAYAEGIGILRDANIGKHEHEIDAETTPLRDPEHYQFDLNLRDIAEVWRRGSVIASWLLDLTANALVKDPELAEFSGRVSDSGEGRWTIKAAIDEGGAGAGPLDGPVSTVHLARRVRLPGQTALGDAVRVRRPCGKDRQIAAGKQLPASPPERTSMITHTPSDALVFFGATGDLAYKKIFPALQAMVKRGHLEVPVIGVAKAGWNLDQLKARARDSLEKHGGVDPAAFDKLCGLLRYVDGDYNDRRHVSGDPHSELGAAQHPAHYLAIPPALFGMVVEQLGTVGLRRRGPRDRRKAVRPRPGLGPGTQSHAAGHLRRVGDLPDRSFPGQSARCRTWSTSGSPTRSWSRSGTATTSRACRSRWPRTSACRAAGAFYEEAGAIRDVIQNHLFQIALQPGDGAAGADRQRIDPR